MSQIFNSVEYNVYDKAYLKWHEGTDKQKAHIEPVLWAFLIIIIDDWRNTAFSLHRAGYYRAHSHYIFQIPTFH